MKWERVDAGYTGKSINVKTKIAVFMKLINKAIVSSLLYFVIICIQVEYSVNINIIEI